LVGCVFNRFSRSATSSETRRWPGRYWPGPPASTIDVSHINVVWSSPATNRRVDDGTGNDEQCQTGCDLWSRRLDVGTQSGVDPAALSARSRCSGTTVGRARARGGVAVTRARRLGSALLTRGRRLLCPGAAVRVGRARAGGTVVRRTAVAGLACRRAAGREGQRSQGPGEAA